MALNNLDINEFELIFNESILKKGLSNCKKGCVEFTEKTSDNFFKYEVFGKEINTVQFIRKSNLLQQVNCTCKKEKCEHLASVIFFIEKEKFEIEIKPKKEKKFRNVIAKKTVKEITLGERLKQIDITRLIDFIEKYAKNNSDFDKLIQAKVTVNENSSDFKDIRLRIFVWLWENKFYSATDSVQENLITDWIKENKLNNDYILQVLAIKLELIELNKDKRSKNKIYPIVEHLLEKQLVINQNYLKLNNHQEEFTQLAIYSVKNYAKYSGTISPLIAVACIFLKDKFLAKFIKTVDGTLNIKYGSGEKLIKAVDYFKNFLLHGSGFSVTEKSNHIVYDTTIKLVLGEPSALKQLADENEKNLKKGNHCFYEDGIYLSSYFNLIDYKKRFLLQAIKCNHYNSILNCELLKAITNAEELEIYLLDAYNFLVDKNDIIFNGIAMDIGIFMGWHKKIVALNRPADFNYGALMKFVKILSNDVLFDYQRFFISAFTISYKQTSSHTGFEYHLKLLNTFLNKLQPEQVLQFLMLLVDNFHPANKMHSTIKLLMANEIKIKN